jgi:hypothetical protein
MRDQARKMGLHPRLIVAPEWTKIPMASEKRASMVAYYSVLIPDARLPYACKSCGWQASGCAG